MKRLSLLLLLSLGGWCLKGQTSSSITISTNPQGARFQVDGTTYTKAVSFSWPQGSEHTVVFVVDPPEPGVTNLVQTATDGSVVYTFNGWEDNNGLVQPTSVPIQVITANPAITTFTAQVTIAYRITLSYFTNPNVNDGVSPPV